MENGEKPQPIPLFSSPKINISETRQIMMICPATIFAKRRMIKAKGLVKTPMNSTRTRMGLIGPAEQAD